VFALYLATTILAQLTTVANMPNQTPIGTAIKGTDLYVSGLVGNNIVKIDLTQPFPVVPTTVLSNNGNRYRIRTVQGAATNYIQNGDMQAALFSGTCNSPVFVSCNDDEDANNNVFNVSFEINTVVGQEYRLLLDGYGGSQGQFCLEVTRIGNVSATDISNTYIRMAPNPTTGIIHLSNVTADEIQVFDVNGRMVQHLIHPGNTIDLTGQPAGFYFLQIVEKKKLYSAQVVKQ